MPNMKLILSLLFAFWLLPCNAQTEASESNLSEPIYFFAQCMYDIDDKDVFQTMEAEFRLNPNIKVARFDWNTKRVFVLTQNVATFTELEFKTWFWHTEKLPTCIQIGVHGIDVVKPYPFTNCNN